MLVLLDNTSRLNSFYRRALNDSKTFIIITKGFDFVVKHETLN